MSTSSSLPVHDSRSISDPSAFSYEEGGSDSDTDSSYDGSAYDEGEGYATDMELSDDEYEERLDELVDGEWCAESESGEGDSDEDIEMGTLLQVDHAGLPRLEPRLPAYPARTKKQVQSGRKKGHRLRIDTTRPCKLADFVTVEHRRSSSPIPGLSRIPTQEPSSEPARLTAENLVRLDGHQARPVPGPSDGDGGQDDGSSVGSKPDEVCPEEEDVRVNRQEHQVIADLIGLSEGRTTFDTWVETDPTAPLVSTSRRRRVSPLASYDPSTHKLVSTGGVLASSSSEHLLSHGNDLTIHHNAVALFIPSPSLPHDIVAHFRFPSRVRFNLFSSRQDAFDQRIGHASHDRLRLVTFCESGSALIAVYARSKAVGRRLDLSVVFDERVVDRGSLRAGLEEVGCSEGWHRTSAPAKRKKAARGLHVVAPSLAEETAEVGNDPFHTTPDHPRFTFKSVCLTDPPFDADHLPSASSTTGTPSCTKIYWGQINETIWKALEHDPDTIVSSVKQHEAREGGGAIWVETRVAILELWERGQEAVEVMTQGALRKEQVGKVASKPSPSFDPGLIHRTAGAQLADIVRQLFLGRPLMHGKKATIESHLHADAARSTILSRRSSPEKQQMAACPPKKSKGKGVDRGLPSSTPPGPPAHGQSANSRMSPLSHQLAPSDYPDRPSPRQPSQRSPQQWQEQDLSAMVCEEIILSVRRRQLAPVSTHAWLRLFM
ncbi:hypothetical protein JCM1840_005192 [Sporobolomyces johnsonii]